MLFIHGFVPLILLTILLSSDYAEGRSRKHYDSALRETDGEFIYPTESDDDSEEYFQHNRNSLNHHRSHHPSHHSKSARTRSLEGQVHKKPEGRFLGDFFAKIFEAGMKVVAPQAVGSISGVLEGLTSGLGPKLQRIFGGGGGDEEPDDEPEGESPDPPAEGESPPAEEEEEDEVDNDEDDLAELIALSESLKNGDFDKKEGSGEETTKKPKKGNKTTKKPKKGKKDKKGRGASKGRFSYYNSY